MVTWYICFVSNVLEINILQSQHPFGSVLSSLLNLPSSFITLIMILSHSLRYN